MGRIRFANQLRGIAALCVACSHLIGVFWAMPEVVSSATSTPPQQGTLPGLFWLVAHTWFNLGPFGVALFFLISGLVVPFSLDRHSRSSFLLARMLRVFPTYIAALLLEVAAVSLSSHVWSRPLPFTTSIVAGNLSLLYDLFGQPSIDLVNWTLSVELKFYIAVAIMAPLVRRCSAAGIVLAGCCIFLANKMIGDVDAMPSTPSYTFSSHSLCLIYMFIGTLFNFHLRGKLGNVGLAIGVAILSALFLSTWLVGVWRTQYPIVTVNYAYALVLFSALYALRRQVPGNALLDGLAAISFPFYLVHSLLGYTLLKVTMVLCHLAYYPALMISFGALLMISLALHQVFELPTQRLGQMIGKRAGSTKGSHVWFWRPRRASDTAHTG